MAGASASGLIRLRKSTLIPPNTSFVGLNTSPEDFESIEQQFHNETPSRCEWIFFGSKEECCNFIRKAESIKNMVLISSGRLGAEVIESLHDLPQLHSIYIYCQKTARYESLKNDYTKLRGIFDNPVELFDKLCENLDKETRESQSNIPVENNVASIQRNVATSTHCLFRNELKSYNNQNTPWCPWQVNSCAVSLPRKGQGTIELWLHEPIPFELRLSNKLNPSDNDVDSYTIVLKFDAREAQLGTVSVQHGNVLHVRDSTTQYNQVQLSENYWHCYWLTFYGAGLMAQYGIGELRSNFKILEAQLPERDKESLQKISYLHVKINNSTDLNAMEQLKDQLKIFIGEEPVIFDPPLLVISPDAFSPTHPANHNGVFSSLLQDPCRCLYDEISKFILSDKTFPNFIETIERSITNPNGWCNAKLKQKANEFGGRKAEATYLCIIVDKLETGIVKHPCLIKIWPSGHYSPIHNHGNVYGVMRILHGKLLIKFFPALSRKLRHSAPIEQLFEENQVTWMIPKLNQTRQMRNPCPDDLCCITIECCQYETGEQVRCERFDYITNDQSRIDHYDSKPDGNYLTFKDQMKKETIRETAV